MKVSIIIDVLNSKNTIEKAIQSILSQTYRNIEFIIIDGRSTDGTLDIINRYQDIIDIFVSEPDNNHFEAMNKGLQLATGQIIGFLHADDVFASDKVIETVANVFKTENVDSLWGDLVYVNQNDMSKVVRYWKSCSYKNMIFRKGWMPPHPTFFARKYVYEKYGYFNTNLPISADYELMIRLLHKNKISGYYLPQILVKMRLGGLSNKSLKNIAQKSYEDYKAWRINGFSGAGPTIAMKNISKIPQFFIREKYPVSS